MKKTLEISWYGRCCFLIEYNKKKILFDPYDTYCNVDIGRINSDITVISSTWHDHGHIGATPSAHIYSYPGEYENSSFIITGIEAKEDRGTPTVIFNVKLGPFSVTNFADFGPESKNEFEKSLTAEQREIIKSTNIAFIRSSIDEKGKHNEIALEYCNPIIIFPEHYFPRSFIVEQIPLELKDKFLKSNIVVNEMIKIFNYPVNEVDSYKVDITQKDLEQKQLIKLLKLEPQVRFAS